MRPVAGDILYNMTKKESHEPVEIWEVLEITGRKDFQKKWELTRLGGVKKTHGESKAGSSTRETRELKL